MFLLKIWFVIALISILITATGVIFGLYSSGYSKLVEGSAFLTIFTGVILAIYSVFVHF